LGNGQQSVSPPARGLREHCKLSSSIGVWGKSLEKNVVLCILWLVKSINLEISQLVGRIQL